MNPANTLQSIEDWNELQFHLAQRENQKPVAEKLDRPFNMAKKQIFEKFIPKNKPLKILEAGCFTAAWGEYFAGMGHDVLCVDLPEVLDIARRDIPVRYAPCDLNNNFPDGKFDIILCTQVIEHVARDFELLRNICTHLEPDGLAFIDTVTEIPDKVEDHGHLRAYPGYSLQALMKTAGFEIVFFARIVLKQSNDENVFAIGKRATCAAC
ncbi:hypothetical protein A2V82_02360 [candidate division KSB1 bacterium RBG_16_48_16]|nr:MAG: hypothetical protein A2V82_02360 [candidate division KSB1 bacterium RBG_16_48_16]